MVDGMIPPGAENKVMHASFRVGGAEVMASDGRCGGAPNFAGVSLSLSVPDEETADRFFSLGLIPNKIKVSEAVWTAPKS